MTSIVAVARVAPAFVLAALVFGTATGALSQDPEPPRRAGSAAPGAVDSIARGRTMALGLPAADSGGDPLGMIGRVDVRRAPLLATRSALDALAGRLAGVSVHPTSPSPGRAPLVALDGRAPGDRQPWPLYVLDGVPLVGPPDMLGYSDIEAVDVFSGGGGASWLGSLANDGVVHMRGSAVPLRDELVVRAKVTAGSSIAPPSPGIARHHDYRVDLAGQYIDEGGNVVSRDERVREPFGVMATPYIVPLHDPLLAVLRSGNHQSAWVSVGRRLESTELGVSVARDRDGGTLFEVDPFRRTHLRAGARHDFGTVGRLSFVAHHAWSEDERLPTFQLLQAAAFYPADIDLRARDDDGAYVPWPAPEVFPRNPVHLLAGDRPLQGRRSVVGAQAGWTAFSWLELHGGVGYDALGRKSSSREVRLDVDGTPSGDTLLLSSAERASLRTIALAATAVRRIGPVDARFTLSVTDAVERDSIADREETRPPVCPTPDDCFDMIASRAQWREASRRVYGAHATGGWGDVLELSLSGRREENEHFPAWDRWRTHYRGVATVDVAAGDWWRWPALDALALSIGHGTSLGFLSREEIRISVFAASGGPLGAEHETATEVALRTRALGRVDLRARHEWTKVRNTPLRSFVLNPPGAVAWQSFAAIERRGLQLELLTELSRGPSHRWTMGIAVDRRRSRWSDDFAICSFTLSERRCPGDLVGTIYGFDWLRRREQLPAVHAGSTNAFAINDDGLLVPVGAGGSPGNPEFGTMVVIDGVEYEWGMPIPVRDEAGEAAVAPIGTAGNDIGLGWSTQLRWRSLSVGGVMAGRLGGDVYDSGMHLRYGSRTHPDLDQSGKAVEHRKPYEYYSRLRNGGQGSSWFLRDATHLILEEVYARLLIPSGRLAGRFGDLEVAVLGRHLATWSRRDVLEPVLSSPGLPADGLRVPRARTVSVRVGLGF